MLSLLLMHFAACGPDPGASAPLDDAFHDAAATYEVPYDLLVVTSYALTRWDHRSGSASTDGAVGLMELRIDGEEPSAALGASLVGVEADDVATSAAWNTMAGAAILRHWADEEAARTGREVTSMADWFPVVARYSGADDPLVADGFANQVYDILQQGLMATTPTGEVIDIQPVSMPWRVRPIRGSGLVDQYVPASASNYTDDNRSSASLVVVHVTEGSYSGAISWFQNSSASASAHYTIRSSDGEVTQSVQEEDIAWHAGHWDTNKASIGIEHEGYVSQPDKWFTEAMYQASAELTRDICDRYGIAKDRAHIIGHDEVPGCSGSGGGSSCHTDPGSGWDWDHYMDLVTGSPGSGGSGGSSGSSAPDGPRRGSYSASVTAQDYGESDSCSGSLSGSITSGKVYLSAKCTLAKHPEKATDLGVVWSGQVSGSTWSGKMVVDGRAAAFSGAVGSDGSLSAKISGTEDLGGSTGPLSYSVTLTAAP